MWLCAPMNTCNTCNTIHIGTDTYCVTGIIIYLGLYVHRHVQSYSLWTGAAIPQSCHCAQPLEALGESQDTWGLQDVVLGELWSLFCVNL